MARGRGGPLSLGHECSDDSNAEAGGGAHCIATVTSEKAEATMPDLTLYRTTL